MSAFNNLNTFANQNFVYGGQGGSHMGQMHHGGNGGHSNHHNNHNNNNNNNNSNNTMYRIPNRIFVGGIPQTANQNELRDYFSSFGHVKDARIITDPRGNSRGYGFVTYENENDANKVLSVKGEELMFKENKLNVGHAFRKKNNNPGQQGQGQQGAGGHHGGQHGMGTSHMSNAFGGMNMMGMQQAGNGHHAPPHHHHAHHYGGQASNGAIGSVSAPHHQQQHRAAPNTYLEQQQQMQLQYGQQHSLNGMHM